jgi:hypothetical protein
MHTVNQLMKGEKQDEKDKNKMPGENNGNEEPVEERSEKIYKMPGNDEGDQPEQKLPPEPGQTTKKIPTLRKV